MGRVPGSRPATCRRPAHVVSGIPIDPPDSSRPRGDARNFSVGSRRAPTSFAAKRQDRPSPLAPSWRRLMSGRPAGEPNPAFAWGRVMPGRDAHMPKGSTGIAGTFPAVTPRVRVPVPVRVRVVDRWSGNVNAGGRGIHHGRGRIHHRRPHYHDGRRKGQPDRDPNPDVSRLGGRGGSHRHRCQHRHEASDRHTFHRESPLVRNRHSMPGMTDGARRPFTVRRRTSHNPKVAGSDLPGGSPVTGHAIR